MTDEQSVKKGIFGFLIEHRINHLFARREVGQ